MDSGCKLVSVGAFFVSLKQHTGDWVTPLGSVRSICCVYYVMLKKKCGDSSEFYHATDQIVYMEQKFEAGG